MSLQQPVVRRPDGTIALRLATRERAVLRALLGDLREIVGEQSPPPGLTLADASDDSDLDPAHADPVHADPVLNRLYPDARPDDPEWSGRFRDMVRGDLDDGRRAHIAVVEETLQARSIDDGQAEAWLHVLNDLRLVLGTRLDVTEGQEEEPFDPDDPDATARVVFAWTGWLEGEFVDVLAASLPVPEGES